MDLKIFQVYYDTDQISKLDKGFIPYFNTNLNISFENEIIKNIHANQLYTNTDYTGVTSWRMYEKTGLTSQSIQSQILKTKADIYLYGNVTGFPFLSDALRRNRYNSAGLILSRAYEKNIFNYSNPELNWVTVFCNYWICKPEIYDKYCSEFLIPLQQFISEDDVSASILKEGYQIHRDEKYPKHPFVYEFLFGLFTYHHLQKLKVEELDWPNKAAAGAPQLNSNIAGITTAIQPVADPANDTNLTHKHEQLISRPSKKITGFYHILGLNNWLKIVTEQLEIIINSGLYDASEFIYIGFNGENDQLEILERLIYPFEKIKVAAVSKNPLDYEFTTLRIVVEKAGSDQFYGFYIHSKGTTSELSNSPISIKCWRDCLNHYTLKMWAWNVEQLNKGYDTSGVQYKDNVSNFPPHYSGNFFWFDSALILRLKPLAPDYCLDRFNAERWLSTSTKWQPANFKTIPDFTEENKTLQEAHSNYSNNYNTVSVSTENEYAQHCTEHVAAIREIINSLDIKSVIHVDSGSGELLQLLNTACNISTTGYSANLKHHIYATHPQRCDTAKLAKYKLGNLDSISDYADLYLALECFEAMEHNVVKRFLNIASRRCRYFYFSPLSLKSLEKDDIISKLTNAKPLKFWIQLFYDCGFEKTEDNNTSGSHHLVFKSRSLHTTLPPN